MAIKNRSRRERRGKCHRRQIQDQNEQLDEPTQSVAKDSDHTLQEILTDSTLTAKIMFMTLMDYLRSLEDAIITNDTKHNLHLLHICIFDTMSSMFTECEETEHANQCNEKEEEKEISQEQADSKNQSNPIDISTERCSSDKKQFSINRFEQQQKRSYFFVNRGITRNFGHRFISFDKMHSSSSFPKSFASYRYKKSRRTDLFYYGENSGHSNNSPIRPWLKRNVTEKKKELSIKFAATNESKSFTFDKEKSEKHMNWRSEKRIDWRSEKHIDWRNEKKTQENYWRTVGYKGSKQHNLKYKDVGTQTDSICSTNNVEMVSVGTMWPEQQPYGCPIEGKDIIWELNYNHEADIEEILHSRYTTNIITPDTDDAAAPWPTNLFNFGKAIRPPPGFPEVPQHSPSDIFNPEDVMLPSLTDNYEPNPRINSVTVIPPAPPPMRHLYYDYPEFMEPPTYNK